MTIESVGAWLWGKFGADIVKQAAGKAKDRWAKFEWAQAAEKYKQRVIDLYSTTRMLGKPEPVSLEGIFTDVFLLERQTALQRFDLEALKAEYAQRRSFGSNAKRVSALRLASKTDCLFILGKPGAGKTTFLKYLTLQAATGKLDRVPIFITLNDWASSSLDLFPFIQRQFEICAFPDAAAFIQQLLNKGAALICFDGLDEVNEADDKRAALTRAMRDFTNQYPDNRYLITCRIAATDYTFEKFTYVEMADFTPEQVQVFARKWFARDEVKAKRFVDELNRDDHRGLRELAQTPLLLTLLCLNFEETLTFPARRAELYEEALDALLKKWDASRNIKRDDLYRGLSLGRKRQLLMRVADDYFERGEIFFRQADVAQHISAFLKSLPGLADADEPEGLAVLKALEAQHGLFVERAHHIYSFSHLTVQEYFTARYIVEHAADGALDRLLSQHLTDDRWREVFLLTTSLLPPEGADAFFAAFQRALDVLISSDEHLLAYGRWAAIKAADYAYLGYPAVARAAARAIAAIVNTRSLPLEFDFARDHTRVHTVASSLNLAFTLGIAHDLALVFDLNHDLTFIPDVLRGIDLNVALDCDRDLVFTLILRFARIQYREGMRQLMTTFVRANQRIDQFGFFQELTDSHIPSEKALESKWYAYSANLQTLLIRYRNIGHDWSFSNEQQGRIRQYERGTLLLAECLQLAAVSDREAIENRLLLPPEG